MKFRVIKLPNNMTALLISDVQSKSSFVQDKDSREGEHFIDIIQIDNFVIILKCNACHFIIRYN